MRRVRRYSFEDFESRGIEAIYEIANQQVEEGVRLEFKAYPSRHGSAINLNEIKKQVSKSLCAFANTYGGTLILGVEKKDGKRPELNPITDFKAIEGNLAKSLNDLLQTSAQINFLSIADPSEESRGFLVLGIEEAKVKPVLTSDSQVFIRKNDSCTRTNQLELIALTLTGRQVDLDVSVTRLESISRDTHHSPRTGVTDIYLTNKGFAPASNVTILLEDGTLSSTGAPSMEEFLSDIEVFSLPSSVTIVDDKETERSFKAYPMRQALRLFPSMKVAVWTRALVADIDRGFKYAVFCDEGTFAGEITPDDLLP